MLACVQCTNTLVVLTAAGLDVRDAGRRVVRVGPAKHTRLNRGPETQRAAWPTPLRRTQTHSAARGGRRFSDQEPATSWQTASDGNTCRSCEQSESKPSRTSIL